MPGSEEIEFKTRPNQLKGNCIKQLTFAGMEKENSLKIKLELLWWGITILIAFGIFFPFRDALASYPFFLTNLFGIIIFLTFTRYIFQLKHSFIGKRQVVKMILMLLCLPILFYYINAINTFQTLLDENGIVAVLGTKSFPGKEGIVNYVRSQFIFFAVGTVIATIVFFVRLIISIWRYRKSGAI